MLTACKDPQSAREQQPPLLANVEGLQLALTPGHLPVESRIQLQLTSPAALTEIDLQITGIGMYMGVIPVRLQGSADGKHWQGEFMLGACTDPAMKWRLTFTLTPVAGPKRQLFYDVQSSF